MKTAAVSVAASLSLLIAGCVLDGYVDGTAAVTVEPPSQQDPVPSRMRLAALDRAEESPAGVPADREDAPPKESKLTDAKRPAEAKASGAAPGSDNAVEGNEGVRDAKVAAEDAARKIYDAAVGAATKIREVGLEAVQAVREANPRQNGGEDPQGKPDGEPDGPHDEGPIAEAAQD